MPNTLLTATAVTREALRVLHQKLNFIGSITRDYDSRFAKDGAKIGDTLKIRLPNQYVVRDGANLAAQDTVEENVELKVQTQKGVDLNFTSVDLTMSLDDFSERIIDPAMSRLAAAVEADAMQMYKDVYQQVNNHAAALTFRKVLDGRKLLQDSLAPTNARTASLNTNDQVELVDALKGLFNSQETISKQHREGHMGRTAGFDFVENTLWPSHMRGAANGAYTANTTAIVSGQTTVPVATGAGSMLKGDIITIAGVVKVHPETKQASNILQQFVVTADYAGGAGNVPVSPALVTDGARQNVAVTGNATAAVTVAGTASQGSGLSMVYQKEAFAFATADLVMPQGVDWKARESHDGLSIRIIRQYDINTDKFPCRLDILYGYRTLRARFAARLANQLGAA